MAAKTRGRYDDVDAKPKSDAYTGLLALSLIAMIASCVVLWMDYAQYGDKGGPKQPVLPKINAKGGAPQGDAVTPPAGGGAAPADLPPLAALPLNPTADTSGSVVQTSGVDEGPALPIPPN